MSNRQSRAQLRLLVTTLHNAGYDAVDKPIKNSRGKVWVSSVRVEGTPLGRGWLLVDEDRDFEPVARVRFDGDADEKLTREFKSVDDAIRYFARTLRSLKPGLSLKTRSYPHHGEGERLPLPNPVGRGALTSDEDRLKSFATRMRKEGFVARPGRDSLEIHATARGYVTFTLLTNQRYNVQQMDDGDTSKNERLSNYWLAEERAAFLARSLRDGQAAAMRAKKTDARYRVALPNPLNTSVPDLRSAEALADKIKAMSRPKRRIEAMVFDPADHNVVNASFSLRVIITLGRKKSYLWLREETVQRADRATSPRPAGGRSANNSRYGVYRDKEGTGEREPFASMHDGSERLLFLVREALYGTKTALREKHRGEYRLPLPNPTPIAHERAKRDAISAASRAVKGATFTAKIVPYTNGGMKTLQQDFNEVLVVTAGRKLTQKEYGAFERAVAKLGWSSWGEGERDIAFKPTDVDLTEPSWKKAEAYAVRVMNRVLPKHKVSATVMGGERGPILRLKTDGFVKGGEVGELHRAIEALGWRKAGDDEGVEYVSVGALEARPNPTQPRYTTRDAARILRTLKLHPRAYGPKELARGMNVEREHHAVTHGDEVMTAKIALAHLRERADYYEVLERAEKAPRSNPTKREQQTILKIQRVLTPDLLKPRYRAGNKTNPMFGHCYAASDALYHLLGGKAAGYKPIVATDDTDGTHWWLLSPKGEILDVTAAQYTSIGKTPPYNAPGAKGCGFSSHKDKRGQQQPGKEAREIIRRVHLPTSRRR